MAAAAPRRARLLLLLALLPALCAPRRAAAQSQGAALERLREALQVKEWEGIDPNKDICQYPGYTTPGVLCDGSTVTGL